MISTSPTPPPPWAIPESSAPHTGELLDSLTPSLIRSRTLDWVRRVVVGLDLCPFARAPLDAGRIEVVVCSNPSPDAILTELWGAIDTLLAADPRRIETTLLVVPEGLGDFGDFLDLVDVANALLTHRGLDGTLQLAHFHPGYIFADAPVNDPANATNRSPYPTLHLLREDSVSRAVSAHPDTEAIPQRNIEKLRSLGLESIAHLTDTGHSEP